MLGGCEIRFREIQVARDELLFQSPWAAHQAAGSSPRRAGVRRRPRWSHEMPPGRDEHEWGEFWGAEERRKKGYEADGGHWYDREEESSDIQQHMLVLGAGTAAGLVLSLVVGMAIVDAPFTHELLPSLPPAKMFTVEEGDRTKLKKV